MSHLDKEEARTRNREEYKRRQEEEARKRGEHKAKLAFKEGLVGHPKLDLLYDLAWEEGHSGGWDEVAIYFHMMAPLLT